MSFFISDAIAQEAGAAGGEPGMVNFVFLIVLFLIFYFLLLRPQIKRAKEHKKMTEALSKNDEEGQNLWKIYIESESGSIVKFKIYEDPVELSGMKAENGPLPFLMVQAGLQSFFAASQFPFYIQPVSG